MYSDQERFNFKVVSILKPITAAEGTNLIEIYNPNWVIAGTDEGADYSAFITFLTATISIKSLGEASIPPIPESATPEEVQKLLDEVATLTQYKSLKILSGFEGQPVYELCAVPVFNQSPFYRISLMPFWAGTNNTLDVGTNTNGAAEVLYLQMADALQGSDRITIRGSAIRRASKQLDNLNKQIAYQTYQRNVQTEAVILAANPQRDNATFVNYTMPPALDPDSGQLANPSDYIIWLKKGSGPGIPINPGGSSYQIRFEDRYKNDVRAYSTKPTLLAVEEGVKI